MTLLSNVFRFLIVFLSSALPIAAASAYVPACDPILTATHAYSKNQQHMLSEVDAIYRVFELSYAPLEWKKNYLGWDLDSQIDAVKYKIISQQISQQRDFQRLLRVFFTSVQDFHVSIRFYSTERSSLPFALAFAADRCFITAIDQEALEHTDIPLAMGDEVLSFDGVDPSKALKDFMKSEYCVGTNLTYKTMSTRFLTARFGAEGHLVPKGSLDLQVRHLDSGEVKTYSLLWDYQPEKIAHRWPETPFKLEAAVVGGQKKKHGHHRLAIDKTMSLPVFDSISEFSTDKEHCTKLHSKGFAEEWFKGDSMHTFGSTTTPGIAAVLNYSDAKNLTRLDSEFHLAFIYETEDGNRIGYIRIPIYMGWHQEIADFSKLIEQLECNTDVLIVDQVNNPGGSLMYMYAMASMLTSKPLQTHTYRQMLKPSDVFDALETIELLQTVKEDLSRSLELLQEDFCGLHVDETLINDLCEHCEFIVDQWNKGHWLTQADPLLGIKEIRPHPVAHYSHPMLILVNELAGSCGDLMPALMQDNQRALILGTKTVGAGGNVLHLSSPNRFGIRGYSYTASFGLRCDGVTPIEDLGVTPDIEYVMQPEDYQHSYRGYYKAIEEGLKAVMGAPYAKSTEALPQTPPKGP